jgi:hypothetical protein
MDMGRNPFGFAFESANDAEGPVGCKAQRRRSLG